MRQAAAVLGSVVFVLGAASVCAQPRDFSGTWTVNANKTSEVDPNADNRVGRHGGPWDGPTLVIAMDAKTVTITRRASGGDRTAIYNLDGSASRNLLGGSGTTSGIEAVSTATWHGSTLVITTKTEYGDQVTKYSMDRSNLKVESVMPFRPAVQTPRTPPGPRFSNSVSQTTIFYTKS